MGNEIDRVVDEMEEELQAALESAQAENERLREALWVTELKAETCWPCQVCVHLDIDGGCDASQACAEILPGLKDEFLNAIASGTIAANTRADEGEKTSILDLEGLGAEIADVNPELEIKALRDEWEHVEEGRGDG